MSEPITQPTLYKFQLEANVCSVIQETATTKAEAEANCRAAFLNQTVGALLKEITITEVEGE